MPKTYSVTVSDANVAIVEQAFADLKEIPMDDQDPPQPKFTQEQWVVAKLEDYVEQTTKRARTANAIEAAKITTQAEPTRVTRARP